MPTPPTVPLRQLSKRHLVPAAVALLAGCTDAAHDPTGLSASGATAVSASRAADRCENVHTTGTATLGPIEVAPGVFTLGALPAPATFAGVAGLFGSVVTGLETSGSRGQGAWHITLVHTFTSADGSFTTSDRAVCAPAGRDPNVCRVNDVLTVVSGTGVFANAGGSLRNHGVIDLNTSTLTFEVRGRVCGDGL